VRIAKTSLSILINTKVLVYIISKNLAKKLRLKVKANDETKVVSLGEKSKVKIIGFISNVLIAVQYFRISRSLYIIGETKSVIILRTDWID